MIMEGELGGDLLGMEVIPNAQPGLPLLGLLVPKGDFLQTLCSCYERQNTH